MRRLNHLQVKGALTDEQIERIVQFERQVYSAQITGPAGARSRTDRRALRRWDRAMSRRPTRACWATTRRAGCFRSTASGSRLPRTGDAQEDARSAARESIARGQDVFMFRTFWIKDSMHLNTVGLGNPTKRTCATCHGMHMTGMDSANGWMDIGTTNLPWATEVPLNPWNEAKPQMPLFRVTCKADVRPHPFLGRVIYTQDPGQGADLRPLQRRGHDRDAAVPRARGARAVLLQRFGADAARARGLLRPALQHRLLRAGEAGSGQLSWEHCDDYDARFPQRCRCWPSLAARLGARECRRGRRRSFVSCPIVRDTASVPCWLAENDGELYFLVLQSDVSAPVTPPWLGHQVLVEGTVSDEPRICGGIVLKPVRLSVLPAIDASCNQMLPAEERYNLTFEPPRPPGPSGGRLAFDGARTPVRTSAPAAADFSAPRDFEIPYTFDGLVGFGHPRYLQAVLEYAQKSKAREIEIVGYRGAAKLTNGETVRGRRGNRQAARGAGGHAAQGRESLIRRLQGALDGRGVDCYRQG